MRAQRTSMAWLISPAHSHKRMRQPAPPPSPARNTGSAALAGTAFSVQDGFTAATGLSVTNSGPFTLGSTAPINVTSGNFSVTGSANLSNNITTSGSQTFGSSLTLGGNVSLTSSTSNVNIASTVAGGGHAFTVDVAGTTSAINGVISNISSLTSDGTGTLTLAGANTYTTTTNISNGILNITNAASLGTSAATATISSNGTLQITGTALTIPNAITASNTATISDNSSSTSNILSGTITLTNVASSSETFNVTNSGETLTVNTLTGGSGTNNLYKTGNGTLILPNSNNYTGTTNISGGTINVKNNTSLSSTLVVVNSGTLSLTGTALTISNTLHLNTGSTILENNASASNTLSGAITLAGTDTINVANATSDTLLLSGAITGSGVSLVKSGVGTLAFSGAGANTFSGTTTINAGTVNLRKNSALGTSTAMVNSTGTLSLTGTTLAITNAIDLNTGSTLLENNANGTNTLSGIITLSGADTVNVSNASNDTLTLSGTIMGGSSLSPVTLTKGGVGLLTLTHANSFTGTTIISNGALNIQNSSALGASTSTVTENAGTELLLSATGLSVPNTVNMLATSALLEDVANGNNVISGTLNITGSVIIEAVNPTNDALTLSGNIIGTGITITKGGTGTVTLSGPASTFTGSTTVSSGTLDISSSSALGNSNNSVTVSSSATLALVNTGLTIANHVILNSGATLIDSNSNGNNVISGNVSLAGTDTISVRNATNDVLTLQGALSGSNVTLDIAGVGTVLLDGTNTFTGTVNVTGGTLSIGTHAAALSTSAVNIGSGATLNLAGSLDANVTNAITLTSATLRASGTNTLSGSNNLVLSGTNTISNASGTLTIANVISGSGASLVINGAGTVALTNTNTYGGSTTLTSGTFIAGNVTNPFSTGILNLNGGTLTAAGTSTVLGNTSFTVGANDNAAIGGSVSLTLPAGTLNTGSTLTINNTGTTQFASTLSGAGAITIGSSSGITEFSGNNSSLSGVITLNGGTLELNNDNNSSPLGTGMLNLNGGTLSALTAIDSNPLENNVTVGGNASIGGAADITFSANNTGWINSGNTLTISNTAATTFDNSLVGSGNITQSAGTTNFSGSSAAYSGIITIGNSTANVTTNTGIGSASVTINAGGTFNINGVTLNSNRITLDGTSGSTAFASILEGNGTASLGGPITITNGSTNNYIIAEQSSVFTLNNNINGDGDLTLLGATLNAIYGNLPVATVNPDITIPNGGVMYVNGEVGTVTALNSLTSNVAITFGGTDNVTVGNQFWSATNPITLVADTKFISTQGSVTIDATINGNYPLTISSADITTINGAIGNTSPVASVAVSGAAINLNGGSIISTGSQTYTGPIVLGNDTTLSATNNNTYIDFTNAATTINSDQIAARALTINSGTGGITLAGNIGSIAPLSSLTLNTTGTITLNNAATSGAQNYNGTVTLSGNTTLSSVNNNINFAGTIDGAYALDINAGSGTVSINGAIGSVQPLSTLDITGTTDLENGAVLTSGSQQYQSMTLGANTTLESSASDVIITGNVTGSGFTFTINNAGVNSAISGSISDIASLTKEGSGTLTLRGMNNYGGTTNVDAGTLSISNDASTLGDSTVNVLAGTTLTINGTLDTSITNAINLTNATLNTNGTNSFSGTNNITLSGADSINVNGSLTLANVVTGSGSLALTGNITFANSNTYSGSMTFSNGTLTANSATNPFGTGTLNLNGGTLAAATNTILGNSSFIIGANDTVTIGGASSMTLPIGTLNTGSMLTLDNTSTTTFNTLSGSGNITQTAGTSIFAGANSTFNGSLTINDGSLASLAANNALGTASIMVNTGSTVEVNNVALTSNDVTLNGGTLTADGTVTLSTPITITAASTNNAIIGDLNSVLTINSNINGAGDLTITNTNGTTILTGLIGNQEPVSSFTMSGAAIQLNGGSILSTGTQSYTGAITLGSDTTLSSSNSNIHFAGTVDGAYALDINAGSGTVSLNGALGSVQPLSTLDITSATNLSGTVITSGTQQYQSMILGANTTLESSASDIIITGNVTGGGFSFTINNAGVNSAVSGSISNIASLTKEGGGTLTLSGVNDYSGNTTIEAGTLITNSATNPLGTGVLNLNGGTLTVAANTVFGNSRFIIGMNDTFILAGANSLTLPMGTLDAGSLLTINNTGTTTFNTLIGSGDITQTAGITVFAGANSTYSGLLTLNNSTASVTANNALGTASVNVNAGATLDINNVTFTSNDITLNGGTLTAEGSVTVNAPVTITTASTNNTIIGGLNSVLTMNGNINGAGDLTITNTTGTTILTGLVGNQEPVSSFTMSGAAIQLDGGSILSTGSQTYTGAVVLGNDTTLSATNNNSAIDFTNTASTIDSDNVAARTLTINAGTGGISLDGNIGSIAPLSSLTLNSSGTITLNSVATTGTQNYNSAVMLGSNTTLSSINSNINFASTVDGTYDLDINAGTGTVSLNGAVGSVQPLSTLDITGTTDMDNGTVLTSGTQQYQNMMLGANTTLDSSANDVIVTGNVTGNGFGLTINNAGANSAINGSISGITSLTKDGSGTLTLEDNVTGAVVITLNSGTLQINDDHPSPLGTGMLNLNGGTISALVAIVMNPLTNDVTLGGNATIGGTNDITFSSNNTGWLTSGDTLTITNTGITTFNDSLVGSSNITQSAGTAVFAGASTAYNGLLTINGGTASVTSNTGIGSASVIVNNGGTFNINNIVLNNNITLNGGTLSADGNATLNGPITLAASSTNNNMIANLGSLFFIDGNINGAGDLAIQDNSSTTTLGGLIGNTTPINMLTVTGTLTLASGSVISTGSQQFNNIVLTNNTTLDSNSSNVTIAGTTTTNGYTLTLIPTPPAPVVTPPAPVTVVTPAKTPTPSVTSTQSIAVQATTIKSKKAPHKPKAVIHVAVKKKTISQSSIKKKPPT